MAIGLFGRRMTRPSPVIVENGKPPEQYDPLGQGLQRPRGLFGRLGNALQSVDWEAVGAAMRDDPSILQNLQSQRNERRLLDFRVRGAKLEDLQAQQEEEARQRAIAALPEDQRVFAEVNPDPFIAAQAPMSAEERAALDFSERQFAETQRHNRASEAIDWTRASREQNGQPTLAEARQWTNSYNDDIRTSMNDLGNMRAAIPYAQEVLRTPQGQNPAGNFRMNDVALLRAAARAQTGPGVLTETEVFGTLSPSLRQDLIRARAYTDIAQSGLDPDDRQALARYVQEAARNASGDLWRRYNDAENVLSARGVDPANVGISAPEYVHPDDMNSFLSVPLGNYRRGRNYTAPSGRRYEYIGDGRFRYSGRSQYDPSRAVSRQRPQQAAQSRGETPTRPPNVPANYTWDANREVWTPNAR